MGVLQADTDHRVWESVFGVLCWHLHCFRSTRNITAPTVIHCQQFQGKSQHVLRFSSIFLEIEIR